MREIALTIIKAIDGLPGFILRFLCLKSRKNVFFWKGDFKNIFFLKMFLWGIALLNNELIAFWVQEAAQYIFC